MGAKKDVARQGSQHPERPLVLPVGCCTQWAVLIGRILIRRNTGRSGLPPLFRLSLSEPEAKAIGGDDVEDPPRGPAAVFGAALGRILPQAVAAELREQ